jgi:hypothetical protein
MDHNVRLCAFHRFKNRFLVKCINEHGQASRGLDQRDFFGAPRGSSDGVPRAKQQGKQPLSNRSSSSRKKYFHNDAPQRKFIVVSALLGATFFRVMPVAANYLGAKTQPLCLDFPNLALLQKMILFIRPGYSPY